MPYGAPFRRAVIRGLLTSRFDVRLRTQAVPLLRHAAMQPPARRGSDGQALLLFALLLTSLVLMAALVVDGGAALVRQRQLQNAADVAALAASHHFGKTGCADQVGMRPVVATAARRTIRAHLPGVPDSRITVSCPTGYNNFAVEVTVSDHAQATFIRLVAPEGIATGARAIAVNRPLGSTVKHSLITLNPGQPRWAENSGCPSVELVGNSQLRVSGSVHVNSSCSGASGNAIATQGGPARVEVSNGTFTVVGSASGQFVPAPDRADPITDPFATVTEPNRNLLPVRSMSRLSIARTTVLEPGYYRGGLEVSAAALLRPGLYYVDGGGVVLRGGGGLYSINADAPATTAGRWADNCTVGECGVLIFNTGQGAMGGIELTGNNDVRLRGYSPAADVLRLGLDEYSNFVIWQHALPRPRSNLSQPPMILRGNNSVEIYGLVYLPSAQLTLIGNDDGSLASTGMTASLVVHDLKLQGSSELTLRYDADSLPQIYDYGLAR